MTSNDKRVLKIVVEFADGEHTVGLVCDSKGAIGFVGIIKIIDGAGASDSAEHVAIGGI